MIYYDDGKLLIRDMIESDAQEITDGEIAQGWHATPDKYYERLKDVADGNAISVAAVYEGCVCGYINVYLKNKTGSFRDTEWPEIVDFGVLEKCRNRGIGGKLMDTAEQIAGKYADTVYLGVGLHSGYGAAQRMYVKRGYVPDGTGVWYRNCICEPYTACENDDDLVIYLSKPLK